MAIPSASNGAVETDRVWTHASTKALSSRGPENSQHIDIIDIRHDAVEINLKEEILSLLRPESGPKKMPTLLLYNERGLQLFEEVCPIYH
jgi:L-histidine Nalpha-methyltransferase / hercynylcysteine S-oxide synthase